MKLNFPLKPDLNEDFIYNLASQNMSASAVDLATGQAMAQDILVYNKEIERLRSALQEIADYEGDSVEESDWPVCVAIEALGGK